MAARGTLLELVGFNGVRRCDPRGAWRDTSTGCQGRIDPDVTTTRRFRALFAGVMTALLLSVAGGVGSGSSPDAADSPSPSASGKASSSTTPTASPAPKKKHFPKGPPMLVDGIAPLSGTTVGVAMPISISFTDPVKVSARKQVEEHIRLTTSVPVSGAWHWFGSQRADFRPRTFWKPGTTVSMLATSTTWVTATGATAPTATPGPSRSVPTCARMSTSGPTRRW